MGNIIYISVSDNIVQLLVVGYSKLMEETFQRENINAKHIIMNNTPILQITFSQIVLQQIGNQKISDLIKDYIQTSNQKIKLRTINKISQLEYLKKFISFEYFTNQQQISILSHNQELLRAYIQQKLIFNFQERGCFYDITKLSDLSHIIFLQVLPEEYLEIYFDEYFKIDKIRENNRTKMFKSPYNEKFNIKLIKKALIQQTAEKSLTQILEDIYTKGNSQNADLLLQDLCGADKCSFIGYPPKLIASALAKYANEEEPTSNIWDQAQSVATAFAVNISLHIIDQINSTKIRKIIFRTNQFYHRKFLYIIQSFVGVHSDIWFVDTSSKSWIQRLQLLPNFLK